MTRQDDATGGDPGQRVAGLHRRHAVVLHADVADYSRLMADDPAGTVTVMRDYQRLVSDAVSDAGGLLVNFVGDSFLAVFDDASSAMRAAVAVCGAVRDRNRDRSRSRKTWFRLGLDAGDIVVADDGSYFGDPLNIAARIQAIAEVGGINVTQAVYVLLDEPALRLVALGSRRLKNIPEPVRVYRLAGVSADTDGARTVQYTEPVVAVLATVHAAATVDREVAEALHVDVVDALGALPGLEVLDAPSDAGTTSARAGAAPARYSLHTAVVRSGVRVRAYAKLIELETINIVWNGRWDGTTDDLFALQDAMTAGTVRAMEVELVIGQPATFYRTQLDSGERAAVYQGWHHLDAGTRDGWVRAIELFSSVLDARSDAVTAHAVLSFARWWGAVQGLSDVPEHDLERAARHATRGVELDDPSGLSHLVLAALEQHAGGDLDAALSDAQRSLTRRPTCDVSYAVLGSVQRYLGDWRAAVEACHRAQELSPVRRPWFATVLASAYYVGDRYHDAAQLAEQVVEQQPDNREALLVLAASQQALGLTRRAGATVVALRERFPDVRRDDLAVSHPFRDAAILQRWSEHLAAAGVS